MEVNVGVAVGGGDLIVVDLAEPVVGGDGAGVGENQAAHRVGNRGVFLHAPVGHVEVAIHQTLVVENGGAHVAQLLPVAAVEDVGLGHLGVAGALEHGLHAVLDGFHADEVVIHLGGEVRGDPQGQKVDDVGAVGDAGGIEGFGDGVGDAGDVEVHRAAIAFDNIVHGSLSFF